MTVGMAHRPTPLNAALLTLTPGVRVNADDRFGTRPAANPHGHVW
jgi:hypothetical protein